MSDAWLSSPETVPPELAVDYQDALIALYHPRDNELSNEIRAKRFGI